MLLELSDFISDLLLCICFKRLFMQHDERCFSNTVLVFFSLSSVFLTMVMSMSLSECGPSVNITFIVVWKQVGRRTWRRMVLCSSCHSFQQTLEWEMQTETHGLNWFQFVLLAVTVHFTVLMNWCWIRARTLRLLTTSCLSRRQKWLWISWKE